jgi:hypothetical protein
MFGFERDLHPDEVDVFYSLIKTRVSGCQATFKVDTLDRASARKTATASAKTVGSAGSKGLSRAPRAKDTFVIDDSEGSSSKKEMLRARNRVLDLPYCAANTFAMFLKTTAFPSRSAFATAREACMQKLAR